MSEFQAFAGEGGGAARTATQKGRRNQPKRWLHPPSNLASGSIIYAVKFWGSTEVAQPKGADVVKGAIERVKFQVHIKKQQGHKPPKVELCISASAIRTQDAKTKGIIHQHPLSSISYCGDDKTHKAVFAYIAREQDSDQHNCFIFETDKFADQITLTVGQAFDIAFKKFKSDSGTDVEMKRKLIAMEQSMQQAEAEKHALRKRIADLQMKKDMTDVEALKLKEQVSQMNTTQQFQTIDNDLAAASMSSRPPAPIPDNNGLLLFDTPNSQQQQPQPAQLDWDPFASTATPAQQPAAVLANTQQSGWEAFETPAQSAQPAEVSWVNFDSQPPAAQPPPQQASFDLFGTAQPAPPVQPVQPAQPAQPALPALQPPSARQPPPPASQPPPPASQPPPPASQPPPQQVSFDLFGTAQPQPPAQPSQPNTQSSWASFETPTSPQQTTGQFQPFPQQQPTSFEPLYDSVDAENIDSAIANIEQQLANLNDGIEVGFSLDPMSPTSPPATGGQSLLQF